jgi:hypothetical protein
MLLFISMAVNLKKLPIVTLDDLLSDGILISQKYYKQLLELKKRMNRPIAFSFQQQLLLFFKFIWCIVAILQSTVRLFACSNKNK